MDDDDDDYDDEDDEDDDDDVDDDVDDDANVSPGTFNLPIVIAPKYPCQRTFSSSQIEIDRKGRIAN